jgi:hypothetical protein
MIVDVFFKNGNTKKYCKAVSIGVMGGNWSDKLYIQTRIGGRVREAHIPLDTIDRYYIRPGRGR